MVLSLSNWYINSMIIIWQFINHRELLQDRIWNNSKMILSMNRVSPIVVDCALLASSFFLFGIFLFLARRIGIGHFVRSLLFAFSLPLFEFSLPLFAFSLPLFVSLSSLLPARFSLFLTIFHHFWLSSSISLYLSLYILPRLDFRIHRSCCSPAPSHIHHFLVDSLKCLSLIEHTICISSTVQMRINWQSIKENNHSEEMQNWWI